MIKVEVKENELNQENNAYPYLAKGEISGVIVLFTAKGKGIVIQPSLALGARQIGDICDSWTEGQFKKFNGTVTLSNES